jgi:hypothetical protein
VKVLQGQALTSIGVLVLMGRVILRAVRGMGGMTSFTFCESHRKTLTLTSRIVILFESRYWERIAVRVGMQLLVLAVRDMPDGTWHYS